jgi:hypothetical protein
MFSLWGQTQRTNIGRGDHPSPLRKLQYILPRVPHG